MKFYIALGGSFFSHILFRQTGGEQSPDENKSLKKGNRLKNEVTELTRVAQKLDQQGRGMEIFRQAGNAEICANAPPRWKRRKNSRRISKNERQTAGQLSRP
jgi:hypothetical protein